MKEIINSVSGHRIYIHPKLIKKAKIYYDWMPTWYKQEVEERMGPHQAPNPMTVKKDDWGSLEYVSMLLAAYNRSVTTKHDTQRFTDLRDKNSNVVYGSAAPKQEKTNWLVRIYNDLFPAKQIPYDDRLYRGEKKEGVGEIKTVYSGWGNAAAAGGMGGYDKFTSLYKCIQAIEKQGWSFFLPNVGPGVSTFSTKHAKFPDWGINFSIPTSIDNPVSIHIVKKNPPPHSNNHSLGRFANFLNKGYTQKRTSSGICNPDFNPILSQYENAITNQSWDLPFMFLKTNYSPQSVGLINYLVDPLYKSKEYLNQLKIEEMRIQKNKELHNQIIKKYNTRNLNKYYKYIQKSLRYSLDYINKDSTLSIKKRNYKEPGTYLNVGLLLDIHNYVIKNLKIIRNRKDEGGGHLEPGNRYHTITLAQIMDYFFTFASGKVAAKAKGEVENLVWTYIIDNIPKDEWNISNPGRCKIDLYNVLLNWCGPLDNFISSIDYKKKMTRLNNRAIDGSSQFLVYQDMVGGSDNTNWKIPSMLFITYK